MSLVLRVLNWMPISGNKQLKTYVHTEPKECLRCHKDEKDKSRDISIFITMNRKSPNSGYRKKNAEFCCKCSGFLPVWQNCTEFLR